MRSSTARLLASRGYSVIQRRFSSWNVHPETGIVSSSDDDRQFQTIIGMEVHAQLDIPTKLFSSAPRDSSLSQQPNSSVWPLDVAVPGVLPRLSKEALHAALVTAAACNCTIPTMSRFERKHYAYADLPLGYQVTQQRWPVARNGVLRARRKVDPKERQYKQKRKDNVKFIEVGIDRIQLEQDTGKTIAVTRREVSYSRG